MTGGAAKVHEASFGQDDNAFAIWKFDLVHLIFDVVPFQVAQRLDLDLGIEVTDIADDGAILHGAHVLNCDDVDIARRRDEHIADGRGIIPS